MPATIEDVGFIPDEDVGFIAEEDVGFIPEPERTPSLQASVPLPGQMERAPILSRASNALTQFKDQEQKKMAEAGAASEQDFQDVKSKIMSPLVTVAPETIAKMAPALSLLGPEAGAGVAEGVADAASSLTSPFALGLIPAAVVAPTVVGAAMSVMGAKGAGEALGAQSVAAEQGDVREAAKLGTQAMISGAQAVIAPIAGVRAAGMPKSAGALAEVATPPKIQPLGIGPEGSQFIQKAIELFTPPKPESVAEIRIDPGARVPRLQPYETEKILATSPEGMARVPVLGAIMDPRATAKTAPDAAIITRAYSVAKGRTLASLWGQSQWRFKDLFKADESTGTIELANGERGYMSDVIEAEIRDPGSQSISPAQRQWISEEWMPLREDVNRMLEQEGVKEVVTEDMEYIPSQDYFPRPAVGKRNRVAEPKGQTSSRPGSSPFFEKSRKYETEFEGARPPREGETKEQIVYDPDAVSRVTKFMLGAYRAVADHRLANDASLGGQSVKSRMAELTERNSDRLSMLDDAERVEAEAQLSEQAAYPIWGKEEQLFIAPAFAGKIYPIESATKLKAAYAEDVRGWVRTAATVTSAAKAIMATGDMSAPFIQGAAMMARHPVRWGKATANSYRSLFDPNVVGKALENPINKKAAEEFSQAGGSLLQLEDFLAGNRPDALATKIPVYGKILESTGRAYGTFLDLAKLELWKAWSEGVPKSEWGRVAESIESSLFMGRMEKVGLNPHRVVGERLMLFAPMYYRGAGGLISTAFQRGVQGSMARQMIGAYATAGTLATIGFLAATGMEWEQIEERMDPTKGTFMKVPVEDASGKRVEVGVGNVLTQLLRLSAQAVDYHLNDKPIDTGVENNPYLRFLRGRAAFIPSVGIEMATGRDYFGNRITIKESLARRFMPFALQSLFPREEISPGQRIMDTAFTFFGLNAFPESDYVAQLRSMDEASRKQSGKPFLELPLGDRALAVKTFKSKPDFQKREPTPQDMERFIHLTEQREMNLKKKLTPEVRKTLEDFGLNVGGYKSTVTFKGVDVPLSHEEQIRYEDYLAEEYNALVPKMLEGALKATPAKRDKWWSDYNEKIRAKARNRIMSDMSTLDRSSQKEQTKP